MIDKEASCLPDIVRLALVTGALSLCGLVTGANVGMCDWKKRQNEHDSGLAWYAITIF